MSSPKRKRDVPVLFWVSAAEMDAIQQKMAQFGTKNLCSTAGPVGAEGTGIPAALGQQQLKPADPQGA